MTLWCPNRSPSWVTQLGHHMLAARKFPKKNFGSPGKVGFSKKNFIRQGMQKKVWGRTDPPVM